MYFFFCFKVMMKHQKWEDSPGTLMRLIKPSFLGKALWMVGTQPPWECCTKGNQSFKKKLQEKIILQK